MSFSIQQPTDGTFRISNSEDSVPDLMLGGPASPTSSAPRFMQPRIAKMAIGVADTGGGVLSWQNPNNFAVIIERVVVDVTTKTTGACTIDVGHTAVSATTSSDTLIDGLDIGTATGTFDNVTEKGSNGKSRQKVASLGWVTASKASGAAAGGVGYVYIHYYPAS